MCNFFYGIVSAQSCVELDTNHVYISVKFIFFEKEMKTDFIERHIQIHSHDTKTTKVLWQLDSIASYPLINHELVKIGDSLFIKFKRSDVLNKLIKISCESKENLFKYWATGYYAYCIIDTDNGKRYSLTLKLSKKKRKWRFVSYELALKVDYYNKLGTNLVEWELSPFRSTVNATGGYIRKKYLGKKMFRERGKL
jgi:hypothetical protein